MVDIQQNRKPLPPISHLSGSRVHAPHHGVQLRYGYGYDKRIEVEAHGNNKWVREVVGGLGVVWGRWGEGRIIKETLGHPEDGTGGEVVGV